MRKLTTYQGRGRMAALAAVALAGSLGLAAVAAVPAGAANHAHKTSHKKSNNSAAAQLAKAESSLQKYISAVPGGVTLNEAGSSLFYPLWNEWSAPSALSSSLPNPPVKLNSAPGGSGKGISEAAAGTVQIGATDAFLSASQRTGPPAMLNIPVVVSAQVIFYNLPSVSAHLKLTPTIINDMYDGAITNWDNKLIAKANPGVGLPNQKIIPVRRSDGSGDTFLITSYMFYGDKTSWNHASQYGGPQLAYSTWPTPSNAISENGSSALLSAVNANVGAFGYDGVSYLTQMKADHLGVAELQNGFGNFELADGTTVANEISSYKVLPPTGAINLIYSKVKAARFGYPDVNYEYAAINPAALSSTQKAAVKGMLAWAMDPKYGAQSGFLGPVNFKPMPVNGIDLALKLLSEI